MSAEIVKADDRTAECIAIRRRVFVEEQGVPEELEIDGFDAPGSGCEHFLVLDGGRPVGTFRAYYESASTVHLQRFCILREARGKGFGRDAFVFAEEYYRSKGAERLTFGAQCTAIGFYEKLGCKAVSGIFPDAGIPHRTMEKQLNARQSL